VLHHDEPLGADRQVIAPPPRESHRARRCASSPGRRGWTLEAAQHADIEMAAAHHRERIAMMEIGAALEQGDRLLAR